MKFSIVTIVFNDPLGLERTIISVINQKYINLEYIIIDGGSVGETLEVINKYKDHLKFWVSEKDNGIFDAMNKSISYVSGDYLCFMNAGDVFNNFNVLDQVAPRILISNEDVYYGDTVIKKEDGRKKIITAKPLNKIKNGRLPFIHQSVFIKTSLMRKIKFPLNYHVSADYYLFLRLYLEGYKFSKLNFVVSEYETGGFSSKNILEGDKQKISILKEFGFNTKRMKFNFAVNKIKKKIKGIIAKIKT